MRGVKKNSLSRKKKHTGREKRSKGTKKKKTDEIQKNEGMREKKNLGAVQRQGAQLQDRKSGLLGGGNKRYKAKT